jgi:protein gp37
MTGISYCDEVLNPVVGCTPCSPACENCWSKDLHDKRHKAYLVGKKLPKQYAKPFSEIQLLSERLKQLRHWRKPRTIFICSGSDLFHEDVPDKFIISVFAEMLLAEQHTFLVLTKRISRAKELFLWNPILQISNIFLGITVWNQESADRDIPILLECWQGKKWLSLEPLLECVDIYSYLLENEISQIIVGAESGKNHRPCKPERIGSITEQCKAVNTSVFVKQLEIDGKVITDPKLFPKDLQRRELIWPSR